jgi:hypothetical protein
MQNNTEVHYCKNWNVSQREKNIVEIIYITKATTEWHSFGAQQV